VDKPYSKVHAGTIMRILSGSSEGQILDARRPLIATAAEVEGAHAIAAHRHPRGQLLYAVSGAMRAGVGDAMWSVTPRIGVWVPPGMVHRIEARAGLSYRSVFVNPSVACTLPQWGGPVEVEPLTRELIIEAAAFGTHYRPDSAESRLIAVLHDRLRAMSAARLTVPLPRDARARRVCEALLDNPADDRSLDAWGRLVGASGRTLARLFQSETSLSFGEWLQGMRLSLALDRLAQGDSVTRIALDLGYASPSAFCAMFRRVLGTTPSRFFH
jgi:AraC-like DNA-binding protein